MTLFPPLMTLLLMLGTEIPNSVRCVHTQVGDDFQVGGMKPSGLSPHANSEAPTLSD